MKTIVMLPTYNEAENIRAMIEELQKLKIAGLEILVVDDQSPDGTWKIVHEMQKKDKTLHLLVRTGRRGRGSAGIAGFKKALAMKADVICEMDADFSHDPRALSLLLQALERADMALGSRVVAGGSDVDRPWYRQFITHLANLYTALVLGLPVRDCNSGYRCFRSTVLEGIGLDSLTSRGPGIVQETLYKAHLKGFKIVEVPIAFIERKKGASKFGYRHLYQGYLLILKLRLQHLLGKI